MSRKRFITDLHLRHAGEPIWIAGTDPSLEDYPDDFFDDKIGITLHLAHLKFPRVTYRYFNEYDRVEFLLREDPSFAQQETVVGWPFYGRSKQESRALVQSMPHIYYLRWVIYPPRCIREYVGWGYTRRKVRQARRAASVTYGGHGTCLHGAIYVAVMMGGNPINIIGCGHGLIRPGEEHFSTAAEIDHRMRPGIRSFSDPVNNVPMLEQTLALIDACTREGIQVNWIREFAGGSLQPMSVDIEELMEHKRAITRPFTVVRRIKNLIKTAVYPAINRFR
jgi:hypothetical protein